MYQSHDSSRHTISAHSCLYLLFLLCALIWAFIWLAILAPATGLTDISWKVHLVVILCGPGLLWLCQWQPADRD